MINSLVSADRGITIEVDGRELRLSWRWLRDHARDDTSFLASAHQRLVAPGTVATVTPGAASTDGAALTVRFAGGPTVSFDEAFLAALDLPEAMYPSVGTGSQPWDAATLTGRFLTIDHDAFLLDAGLDAALAGLTRDGVIALRDVPRTTGATRTVLERFGYVRSTIFGDLWEFSSDDSAGVGFDDTASTPLEITPHTDGTYSNDAPGLLGLHCHRYRATGGENVFADGAALAGRLATESPEHVEVLRTVEIPAQYIGDGAHLVARRPPLRYEGVRLVQVTYNHHDRAPFLLPEPAMAELYDALHHFDTLANTPDMQFELAMRPGDMVIFDNWRVLHGRRAFTGARHIAGGYINREDFDSTMRQRSHLPTLLDHRSDRV